MLSRLICIFFIGNLFSQDDGQPPNFVNIEPIEDFYSLNPIELEIIVTDRNEIEEVLLFYKFNDETDFNVLEMKVSYQPVIFNVKIPMEDIKAGFIQYYFWSKDEYQNGSTWPAGGEDMPIVYPVYSARQDEATIADQKIGIENILDAPKDLENNLPYYLEISMLAPFQEVKEEDGIPIIVLSVFDPEKLVNLESVRLLVDDEKVSSFNDLDMITYVPQDPIPPGYHIVRYESQNNLGEDLYKEFLFLVIEKEEGESAQDTESWKDKIKFKGNLGWDSNYDQAENRPGESQKVNSSIKFQLGKFKFNLYGLFNTHFNIEDRYALEYRQPLDRVKFKMNSPNLDFFYGDNSLDFSDLSLKGTRVRGLSTKLKLGKWHTSFVSGETKHRIDYRLSQRSRINDWNILTSYQVGDTVYYDDQIWESSIENQSIQPDTASSNEWVLIDLDYTKHIEISNDECIAIDPALYGEILDEYNIENNLGIDISQIDIYAIWNGQSCQEVKLYSTINMITGEDGLEVGVLFDNLENCFNKCMTLIDYTAGANKRELEGFRTSTDLFNHAKFGISFLRSRDYFDNSLIPYSLYKEAYNYEGNIVASTDFSLRFNNDKTKLSGEYGISLTLDQSKSDTLILKTLSNIDHDSNLYTQIVWNGSDYCSDVACFDLDYNNEIDTAYYDTSYGIIDDSILWKKYQSNADALKEYAKFLSFNFTDDIGAYDEGRGFSGLKSQEFSNLISGGLDSIYLLLKRPTFKVNFKTPITLPFTVLMFQTEVNQASINYRSNGSSSIQNNLRNWKNKIGFKLLKNQISISLGYDRQIKSPWDPDEKEIIKRTLSNTRSGSIGLNIPKMPTISYSFRFQNRQDKEMGLPEDFDDLLSGNGTWNEGEEFIDSNENGVWDEEEKFTDITYLGTFTPYEKKLSSKLGSTHTFAPAYKFKFQNINMNYNGNISITKDLDMLSDTDQCVEILNSEFAKDWGGEQNTVWTDSCGSDINKYWFKGSNDYPFKNSGTITSTLTNALSFSFSVPLSINLGWGYSKNSPNDARKSETIINVLSTKVGYKLFDKKLSLTLGANYILGYKPQNNMWDSGEELIIDRNGVCDEREECIDLDGDGNHDEGEPWIDLEDGIFEEGEEYTDENGNGNYDDGEPWIDRGSDNTYTPGDTFIDKVELDNYKITLKGNVQYRIPKPNITLSLNINYTESINNLILDSEPQKPLLKAKFSIKLGF